MFSQSRLIVIILFDNPHFGKHTNFILLRYKYYGSLKCYYKEKRPQGWHKNYTHEKLRPRCIWPNAHPTKHAIVRATKDGCKDSHFKSKFYGIKAICCFSLKRILVKEIKIVRSHNAFINGRLNCCYWRKRMAHP